MTRTKDQSPSWARDVPPVGDSFWSAFNLPEGWINEQPAAQRPFCRYVAAVATGADPVDALVALIKSLDLTPDEIGVLAFYATRTAREQRPEPRGTGEA